jgi:hypothetical protein
MKLSFILNVWYDLSLDLSFDPFNPKLWQLSSLELSLDTLYWLWEKEIKKSQISPRFSLRFYA